MAKTQSLDLGEDSAEASVQHVFPADQFTSWLLTVLAHKERFVAFLCGAPGSGKTTAGKIALEQFGSSIHLISASHSSFAELADWAKAIEDCNQKPTVLICDGPNTSFADFADRILVALDGGVSLSNFGWFVFDNHLPEAQEVEWLLCRCIAGKRLDQSPATLFNFVSTIREAVQRLRSTFFVKSGSLVQWTNRDVLDAATQHGWAVNALSDEPAEENLNHSQSPGTAGISPLLNSGGSLMSLKLQEKAPAKPLSAILQGYLGSPSQRNQGASAHRIKRATHSATTIDNHVPLTRYRTSTQSPNNFPNSQPQRTAFSNRLPLGGRKAPNTIEEHHGQPVPYDLLLQLLLGQSTEPKTNHLLLHPVFHQPQPHELRTLDAFLSNQPSGTAS